ncbi:hypothetical protein NE477_17850 [Blautia marasmi]|nr:hypothetical protein [uncultured Blautia sp.]MCQ4647516.1 hypothetical protein [Blautia marasmi]MCQ4866760.1 hypothetical protein [Blautia producta]MCQ4979465.1 hypothetical protein [Blautia producta]UOX59363.1 hypothetical protein K5I22_05870 [Clostridia bacterium UC5.1-1D4]
MIISIPAVTADGFIRKCIPDFFLTGGLCDAKLHLPDVSCGIQEKFKHNMVTASALKKAGSEMIQLCPQII